MISEERSVYRGRMLRVDLTNRRITSEVIDESTLRKSVGGASLGIKLMYDEVSPGIKWSDPQNRLFIGTGPLGGTRIEGSGSVALVTKGALTNGIASSQANGFLGMRLRKAGFDAIVVEGASDREVYLHVHDGTAELRDACHLAGKDTYSTEAEIREELQRKKGDSSVLSIGPAGENLVKFALTFSDTGHVASHNGIGAVMGSKKLKAIVVDRGKERIPVKDEDALKDVASKLKARVKEIPIYNLFSQVGTVGGIYDSRKMGILPVKNYTTSIYAIDQQRLDQYQALPIRERFEAQRASCWGCSSKHCHEMVMPDGKYAGRVFEEPEYECMASWSSLVGITDVSKSVLLSNEVDRLGMDTNEAGWVIAWVMECYEKGLLTRNDLDGIEMRWGDDDAIMAMLHKIARREGIGNLLANGVMRASREIGGETVKLAVHTLKGNTPRSHDHRMIWYELFDTCISNLGTLEAGSTPPLKVLGLSPTYDPFDPQAVSTVVAQVKGGMVFEDSMVTCRFRTGTQTDLLALAVDAVTGWDMDLKEAMQAGSRAINLARAFNLRHGVTPDLDRPSTRYGSTPLDGGAAGVGIMHHFDEMLRNYYKLMGWGEQGIPLPETLKNLSLESVIPDLWDGKNPKEFPAR
jgi:aldehyde:ferredoxin oxidoreductase